MTICHPVTVTLLREHIEPQLVSTAFVYDPADPLAVQVVFNYTIPVCHVVWTCARDLLAEGLIRPAGVGDFRVGPAENPDWLILELRPHGWLQQFAVPREAVAEFLAATFSAVPPSRECAAVEAELESFRWADL